MAFGQLAMGNYSHGYKSFNWRLQGDETNLPK